MNGYLASIVPYIIQNIKHLTPPWIHPQRLPPIVTVAKSNTFVSDDLGETVGISFYNPLGHSHQLK